jgi:hypothetical protein
MPLTNVDGMRSTGPASFRFFIRDSTSGTMGSRLYPGQVRAEAEMRSTAAECDVRVRCATHLEAVGIGEPGLVPVGRRVEHRRPVALFHAHPA